MPTPSTKAPAVEPWGPSYKKRTKNGETGAECIVCGRQTGDAPLYAIASPATGNFVPASLVGTPEGERLEASAYPIGPECAKKVRAAFPASVCEVR